MRIASLLVVCHANVCRSPVAEAYLRSGLPDRIEVSSAGTHAVSGAPAHPHAVSLLARQGLDLSGHRATRLSPGMAAAADLILVMDTELRQEVAALYPAARGRVFLLGQWHGMEIADPITVSGISCRETLNALEMCAASWIERLS